MTFGIDQKKHACVKAVNETYLQSPYIVYDKSMILYVRMEL